MRARGISTGDCAAGATGLAALAAAGLLLRHDATALVAWWLSSTAMALAAFPLTAGVLRRFPDGGYAAARILGLLATGYGVWLLEAAPWPRAVRAALPFAVLAALAAAAWRGNVVAGRVLRHRASRILGMEGAFLALLCAGALLRSVKPEAMGLEKFMDFGLVNACFGAERMPPPDPWFAGAHVNYYYFGHFLAALQARLSFLSPDRAFNLIIPSVAAQAATAAMMLVATGLRPALSRGRALAGGALAATLAFGGGNMHTPIYAWLHPLWLRLCGFRGATAYWFPDATRFIRESAASADHLIHEFPLYSFVVADPHANVLGLPLALLFLCLIQAGAWRIARGAAPRANGPDAPPRAQDRFGLLRVALLAAGTLACMAMTNTWDVAVYGTLMLLCWTAAALTAAPRRPAALAAALTAAAVGVALWIVPALPFLLAFRTFAQGVGLAPQRSVAWQWLTIWGAPALIAAWFAVDALQGAVRVARSGLRRRERQDVHMAVLGLSAIGLTLLPELIYVRDIYAGGLSRANTEFKLGYQAFVLFGLTTGYAFSRWVLGPRAQRPPRLLRALLAALVLPPLAYGAWALPGMYGKVSAWRCRGLDGLAFMRSEHAGDWDAVRWLRANTAPSATVLEATGPSFTYAARISTASGRPTVLGWDAHERLWRNDTAAVSERAADVAAIYQADDREAAERLVAKYAVRYIVLGDEELRTYPNLQFQSLVQRYRAAACSHGTLVLDCAQRPPAP